MSWNGFIGLGVVDENGDFTEVDVPGYARARFGFNQAINGKVQGVGHWIDWYAVPNRLDLYNGFGFFDSESGGNPVMIYPEATIHTMGAADHASMNPYQIMINIVDQTTGSGFRVDPKSIDVIANANHFEAGQPEVAEDRHSEEHRDH